MKILELGCGDNPVFSNSDLIDHKERGGGKFVDVLMDRLPYDNDTYDLIVFEHIIEHLYRWRVSHTFGEMLRILKPGGKVRIKCPNLKAAAIAYADGDNAWFDKASFKVNLDGPTGTLGEKFMKFCVSPGQDSVLLNRRKEEIGGLAHVWGWDKEQVETEAFKVGFKDVNVLHNDEEDWELYMELVK